jgi:hypothetical protein
VPVSGFDPCSEPRQAFTARTTSKVLLADPCITVLLAALGLINIAAGITVSLVVYLRILYLPRANAHDVALLKSLIRAAGRLTTNDASKKQEDKSNNLSSRYFDEIATSD